MLALRLDRPQRLILEIDGVAVRLGRKVRLENLARAYPAGIGTDVASTRGARRKRVVNQCCEILHVTGAVARRVGMRNVLCDQLVPLGRMTRHRGRKIEHCKVIQHDDAHHFLVPLPTA